MAENDNTLPLAGVPAVVDAAGAPHETHGTAGTQVHQPILESIVPPTLSGTTTEEAKPATEGDDASGPGGALSKEIVDKKPPAEVFPDINIVFPPSPETLEAAEAFAEEHGLRDPNIFQNWIDNIRVARDLRPTDLVHMGDLEHLQAREAVAQHESIATAINTLTDDIIREMSPKLADKPFLVSAVRKALVPRSVASMLSLIQVGALPRDARIAIVREALSDEIKSGLEREATRIKVAQQPLRRRFKERQYSALGSLPERGGGGRGMGD
jgi:hypothetical protein